MTLKAKLMELNSIETGWGIWATAPFTAASDYRVGELHFENGGVLDEMHFVGSLADLSIAYSPPVVCVRWGYTESEVSTTDGAQPLFELGEVTDAVALWTQHVAPMLADTDAWVADGYAELVVETTAEAFQTWLTEVQAALDCHAHLDTLTLASGYDDETLGWLELYVEERDGLDAADFREAAAEQLIEDAEACRQDRETTGQ